MVLEIFNLADMCHI